jgi:anthranilate phosphoribosyltransferase
VLEVRKGTVREFIIDPSKFGLPAATAESLAGGAPAENARIVTDVLAGRERGGARSAVLLNAAAAILVSGLAADFGAGMQRAAESIDSGKAAGALELLRKASAKR